MNNTLRIALHVHVHRAGMVISKVSLSGRKKLSRLASQSVTNTDNLHCCYGDVDVVMFV